MDQFDPPTNPEPSALPQKVPRPTNLRTAKPKSKKKSRKGTDPFDTSKDSTFTTDTASSEVLETSEAGGKDWASVEPTKSRGAEKLKEREIRKIMIKNASYGKDDPRHFSNIPKHGGAILAIPEEALVFIKPTCPAIGKQPVL